jgi:hypothetical protein
MKVIKSTYKPVLKAPKFLCDDPICKHLENKGEFFDILNHYNSYAVVGKAGSGKTSIITAFLTGKGENRVWRKSYNHIILVMPLTSRRSLKDINFDEILPPDQVYDDLEDLDNIYNQLMGFSEKNESTLLLIDDMQAYFKEKSKQKLLCHIMNNRRHLKCSTVFLVQNLKSMIPAVMRRSLTTLFIFNGISKSEMEGVFLEYYPNNNKDEFLKALNMIKNKHEWLCIYTNDGGKIFNQQYDRVIFNEEEE